MYCIHSVKCVPVVCVFVLIKRFTTPPAIIIISAHIALFAVHRKWNFDQFVRMIAFSFRYKVYFIFGKLLIGLALGMGIL